MQGVKAQTKKPTTKTRGSTQLTYGPQGSEIHNIFFQQEPPTNLPHQQPLRGITRKTGSVSVPGDGKVRVRLDKKMTRVNSIDQDTLTERTNPQIDVNYLVSGRGTMHVIDERALVDISGDVLNTAQGPSETVRKVT